MSQRLGCSIARYYHTVPASARSLQLLRLPVERMEERVGRQRPSPCIVGIVSVKACVVGNVADLNIDSGVPAVEAVAPSPQADDLLKEPHELRVKKGTHVLLRRQGEDRLLCSGRAFDAASDSQCEAR